MKMEDFSDSDEERKSKGSDDESSGDSECSERVRERAEQAAKAHRHAMAKMIAEREKMKDTARSSKGFLQIKSKKG